jgi:hypothetical protein
MERYIGTKLVNAKPMTRREYNDFRGWALPDDEDGGDLGMLVEYVDGGKANTEAYEGYVSWSPIEVFNKAYRTSGNLTFGDAVELMKLGDVMTRTGWNGRRKNGKPMFVQLIEAGEASTEINKPFFVMVHADDSVGVWTPVTNDVLASDWAIVES